MTKITVIGAGLMGTAVIFPAADNGHDIHLVGTHLDTQIIDSCLARRYHPRLKRQLPDNVHPYYHTQIAEAMQDAEVIVLGVNSRGVHWAADAIGPHLKPGQIILMVTKGLESTPDGDLRLLPDVVHDELPEAIRDKVFYAAIGGPSIAGELAGHRHTNVIFVSRNADILPRLRALFATDYYHVWTSTDIVGVEVCVALKNPYTLAVGLAAGIVEAEKTPDPAGAQMYNYAAALFAQGLSETAYLVKRMGGNLETVFSLPGAGDLYVTSQGGRNTRLAKLLGKGLPYSAAVEEMHDETIEGIDALLVVGPAVERMVELGKIEADALPLIRKLYRIITHAEPANFDFDSFFGKLSYTTGSPGKSE